jgi:hypothetical protein
MGGVEVARSCRRSCEEPVCWGCVGVERNGCAVVSVAVERNGCAVVSVAVVNERSGWPHTGDDVCPSGCSSGDGSYFLTHLLPSLTSFMRSGECSTRGRFGGGAFSLSMSPPLRFLEDASWKNTKNKLFYT